MLNTEAWNLQNLHAGISLTVYHPPELAPPAAKIFVQKPFPRKNFSDKSSTQETKNLYFFVKIVVKCYDFTVFSTVIYNFMDFTVQKLKLSDTAHVDSRVSDLATN